MTTAGRILAGQYQDSVQLMRAAEALREGSGIEAVGVVMGTPRNLEMLDEASLMFDGGAAATPNDIVVALRGTTEAVDAGLAEAQAVISDPRGGSVAESYASLRAAAGAAPAASLVLISVPGDYAADEAREALERGLDVMLFSDNVSIEDELALKRAARDKGRLVMGPDCGTAIVNGAALGFANQLPLGPVGIAAASGTGAQVVSTELAALGTGVSQLLGLGGRDLEDAVGGLSLLPALETLDADPQTEVIVIVAKKAGREVFGRLLASLARLETPVVACILGGGGGAALEAVGAVSASSLEDAARLAKLLSEGGAVAGQRLEWGTVSDWRGRLPGGLTLQGRFAGGTLAQEALGIARAVLGDVDSNLDPQPQASHRILDLGADEYTAGAPHPMINPAAQAAQVAEALTDSDTGAVLFDVVLGHGGHPNPAALLAPAVEQGLKDAASAGRDVLVVASCCGTEADPQRLSSQIEALTGAGALVVTSNARATGLAALALADQRDEMPVQALDLAGRWGGQVINVGSTWFADALTAQGVGVVQVDWRPPAQGDEELRALLRELD